MWVNPSCTQKDTIKIYYHGSPISISFHTMMWIPKSCLYTLHIIAISTPCCPSYWKGARPSIAHCLFILILISTHITLMCFHYVNWRSEIEGLKISISQKEKECFTYHKALSNSTIHIRVAPSNKLRLWMSKAISK